MDQNRASNGELVEYVRKAVLLRDGGGLSDGQLLEQYVQSREAAAFARAETFAISATANS